MVDWDDLKFFLALAQHGSLSAAAQALGVAESTLGRRLITLEASLGVRLLDRTPAGYVPTLAGQDFRDQAERLEAEALSPERNLGGRVRVTCPESIASHVLAPCVAAQRLEITMELIPDTLVLRQSMRGVDIAVRLAPPDQHDLVVHRVGTLVFGLYASAAYLERHGAPDFAAGCTGHSLITQSGDIQDAAQAGWLADVAPGARVALHTSGHEPAVAAALRNAGLACLARFRANQEPALTRLATPSPVPSTGIWLVVHRSHRRTARIRAALTHIKACVRGNDDLLQPDETRN